MFAKTSERLLKYRRTLLNHMWFSVFTIFICCSLHGIDWYALKVELQYGVGIDRLAELHFGKNVGIYEDNASSGRI